MLIWWLRSRKCAKGGPAWFRLPAIPCWVDEANVWLMGGFKHLAAGSLMSWFGASIVWYGPSRPKKKKIYPSESKLSKRRGEKRILFPWP
jgi:hypothetical protein